MHLIPLSSILVEDRQRKTLRNIPELAESIRRVGLIHAPVVEPLEESHVGLSGEITVGYRLIAGERRLRAIESLQTPDFGFTFIYAGDTIPVGMLPVTFRSELSDVQRREIELEENLLRENLTWQEEALAIADLHSLRERQHGSQTIGATAAEVAEKTGEATSTAGAKVSRAITVAKQLSDPKVAGARNLKEAANIVNRAFEAQVEADLIKAVGDVTHHELLAGSALELLPTLPADYFDCILADPPYGMGADSFGSVGPQHGYKDDWENAQDIYEAIFNEGYRVCRANAHLYVFCDFDNFQIIRERCQGFGWRPFRTPLIWNKTSSMGHDPWPMKGFRRSYECILYAMKGDRPYLAAMEDVIDCANVSNPLHPAAKPPELFRKLLARTCHAGDRVLDPCCGIGTIFEAASALRVQATGIELDPDYAQIASNRRFEGRK